MLQLQADSGTTDNEKLLETFKELVEIEGTIREEVHWLLTTFDITLGENYVYSARTECISIPFAASETAEKFDEGLMSKTNPKIAQLKSEIAEVRKIARVRQSGQASKRQGIMSVNFLVTTVNVVLDMNCPCLQREEWMLSITVWNKKCPTLSQYFFFIN